MNGFLIDKDDFLRELNTAHPAIEWKKFNVEMLSFRDRYGRNPFSKFELNSEYLEVDDYCYIIRKNFTYSWSTLYYKLVARFAENIRKTRLCYRTPIYFENVDLKLKLDLLDYHTTLGCIPELRAQMTLTLWHRT